MIGHLTHACQLLGGAIGLSPWLPQYWGERYGTGSVPLTDAARYGSKASALETLGDAQSRITAAVVELTDAQLDAPFPVESYRHVFPTGFARKLRKSPSWLCLNSSLRSLRLCVLCVKYFSRLTLTEWD